MTERLIIKANGTERPAGEQAFGTAWREAQETSLFSITGFALLCREREDGSLLVLASFRDGEHITKKRLS